MQVYTLPYDTTSRSNVVFRITNSSTDLSGTGKTLVSGDSGPTTISDYLQFNGSQVLRYPANSDFHDTGNYSVELEFYIDVATTGYAYIATVGEGYGIGWPEWHIIQTPTTIDFSSSSNNNGVTSDASLLTNFNLQQWYRVGIMFFNNMAYGFVNDIQVFSIACSVPYTSTNGLAIGCDYAKYSGRFFTGKIRNMTIGKSLFWSLQAADVNTAPYPVTLPGSLGTFDKNSNIYIPITFKDAENNIKSYAITSGNLPSTVTINSSTGVLSGSLGDVSQNTTYQFTVTVTDFLGLYSSVTYYLNVSYTGTEVVWNTSENLGTISVGQETSIQLSATSI